MPVHDWEHRVETHIQAVEESEEINDRNKELIRKFKRDKLLNGQSDATMVKNLARLKAMGKYAGETPFDEMDKDDLKDMVEWIQSQDYADGTIFTYKTVIRSFWKWMKPQENGDAPEEIAWIKLNYNYGNDKLPEDLLTKEDVRDQIRAAHNERDKAFIALLYETGARIGELIDLTVGSIEDRENGKKVVIRGKTGARRLPLVESVPHLNDWLSKHPKPDKDAPIWCKIQQGGPDAQLGYRYLRENILKRTMEAAGVDKPSNPHHYRHSRASYLANEMTEAQLCQWFGWVQGSDIPAKYVHLSGRDIDQAYDSMFGLSDPEGEEEKPDIIECERCQELNEPDAAYCKRCGLSLDQERTVDLEEDIDEKAKDSYKQTPPEDTDTQNKVEEAEELLNDPEVKEALLAKWESEG